MTVLLDVDDLRDQARNRGVDFLNYINVLSNTYAKAANRLKNLDIAYPKLDETTKRDAITIRDTNLVKLVEKK
jgi:hypothetical protein